MNRNTAQQSGDKEISAGLEKIRLRFFNLATLAAGKKCPMRKKKARSDRAELTNDDTDTLKNQHHIEARLETWILIRRPSLGHRSDQKIPAAPTGIRSEVAGEEKRTAGKAALQSYIGSSYINVRNRPERSVPRSTDPCGIYGIFDKNLSDTSPPNFLLNSEARVHFYYSYQ